MMNRNNLRLLPGIVAVVGITVIIGTAIYSALRAPTPVSVSSLKKEPGIAPKGQEGKYAFGLHNEGEPMPADMEASLKLLAQHAAEAYATYPLEESPQIRRDRLARFFAPDSRVFATDSNSAPTYTTTSVDTLMTEWYDPQAAGMVGVRVYLSVAATESSEVPPSEINQTWEVKLKRAGQAWVADSVEESGLTYLPARRKGGAS